MKDGSIIADKVWCYNVDHVVIGSHAIISQKAVLCTASHDIDNENFKLVTGSILIGERAWVAAEAFVGPGVKVNTGAVLGARAVTFKDLAPWTVYIGNPAKALRGRRH